MKDCVPSFCKKCIEYSCKNCEKMPIYIEGIKEGKKDVILTLFRKCKNEFEELLEEIKQL